MPHYLLDGHKAIACNLPVTEWAIRFEGLDRRVALTEHDEIRVSTVFLGIDYSFTYTHAPLIFETMIFGGPHDQYYERYSTWEEAEAGHAEACKLAFKETPNP